MCIYCENPPHQKRFIGDNFSYKIHAQCMKKGYPGILSVDSIFETINYSIHINVPISNCPWCGRDLQEMWKETYSKPFMPQ